MPTTGLLRTEVSGRAVERGVPEGEDTAVGGDEPVPAAVGRRGRADDRFVQCGATFGAEERGAEREHTAVGGDHRVPTGRRIGRDGDDGLVEHERAGRAPERRVPEREDTPVGADEPVAAAVRRGRHRHDGSVRLGARQVTERRRPEGPHRVWSDRAGRSCRAGRARRARDHGHEQRHHEEGGQRRLGNDRPHRPGHGHVTSLPGGEVTGDLVPRCGVALGGLLSRGKGSRSSRRGRRRPGSRPRRR